MKFEYQNFSINPSLLTNSNIVIVSHASFDGANFLISCLSISEKSYFNNFDKHQKVKFFIEKLENNKKLLSKSNTHKKWSDPGMYFPSYQSNTYKELKNVGDKYLFVKTHFYPPFIDEFTPWLKNINFKKHVIILKNNYLFYFLRNVVDEDGADRFNSDEIKSLCKNYYGLNDLDFYQYFNLNEKEKQKLKNEFNEFYENKNINDLRRLTEENPDTIFLTWDVNWFLSEKETLDNMKKLYENLGLPDYNEKIISFFYNRWIYLMNELKKQYIEIIEDSN